jgi:hypothetical protein
LFRYVFSGCAETAKKLVNGLIFLISAARYFSFILLQHPIPISSQYLDHDASFLAGTNKNFKG